ncbi:MAG: hypothetical protein MJ228_03895 [Bacilli bacterium]|nr:hypothetical protein [Bacilli bacterium]
MKKIKDYLQNKGLGIYLVCANILISLVLILVFLPTYKAALTNGMDAAAPEVIPLLAGAGLLIEAIVLLSPEVRFLQLGAVAMFALAMAKEIFLIAPALADVANNVHYQGGSFETQLVYLIMLFVLVISSIVALFLGLFKNEEEQQAEIKGSFKGKKLIKNGASSAVALVLAAVCGIASFNMGGKSMAVEDPNITPELRKAAEECDYDFDPEAVIVKEQESYDFNDATVKGLTYNADITKIGRKDADGNDIHFVYIFEGRYAEGYQGDYSETLAYFFLYEDGLFVGNVGGQNTQVRGYWYNSSLEGGYDAEADADIKDCLVMRSNVNNYDSIITNEATDFYCRYTQIYLGFSWGTRSMVISGYYYYPEIGALIDTGAESLEYHVGDTFSTESWRASRVLKNLKYQKILAENDVKWTIPEGMVDANGDLAKEGIFDITIKYKDWEASKTITVLAAEEE